ncbi:MAG: phosphodiesterase [Alphaproteobacteria bacterium]
MLIAQITDLHVTAPGVLHKDGFDPAADTGRCLEALARFEPRPDLVLMTGDLAADGGEEEYRRLKDMLSDFPLPFRLLAGNHDRREALRAVFGPLADDRPERGFLHYAFDAGPVRIVALDTMEPGETGGVLCAERLAWFEETLAQAPDTPTLVALHHPPFLTGLTRLDAHGFKGREACARLIAESPQVRLVVSGHTHRTVWTRIGNAAACTCPSPTFAFPADLRPDAPKGKSTEAGGFMLHLWRDGEFVTHTVLMDGAARM